MGRKVVITALIIFLSLAGVCVAAFFVLGLAINLHWIRAFRISSDSMCPAICENERILASLIAYRDKPPTRGQIIMLKSDKIEGLLIKRVIGVEGDVISQKDDKILVNGASFHFPSEAEICGKQHVLEPSAELPVKFEQITVPPNSFFVVGDNLNSSNDSRIPGFGFVDKKDVRGKPLFIYWSAGDSRFGCSIR